MWMHSIVLSLTILVGAPIDVTRLEGDRLSGELSSLSAQTLVIEGTNGPVEIPVSDLQGIQVSTSPGTPAPLHVHLVDESLLAGEKVSIVTGKLTLSSQELGELVLSTAQVHSVLLAPVDDKLAPAWEEMRKRASQSDLLVIRKGENLDFVGGTIGSVDDAAVTLISRGREAKVPREKIVGVVYATHKLAPGSPTCEVTTANGSRLRVKSIEIAEGQAALTLAGTTSLKVPSGSLLSLDYALGRIIPLMKTISSQKLPEGVSESIVAVRSHAYSSSTLQRIPLLVGGKSYSEGLLIHPQTRLEFTLNRQFRKLRAVVGIDENASERSRFEPVVQVQVLADGKPLWDKEVRWDAPPESIDLDLADVKRLEIVTSSGDGKIGPLRHLDFADAKLIK